MQEFVEKLIDRLDELHIIHSNKYAQWNGAIDEGIEIVNELSKEYINTSNNWIPVSESLPRRRCVKLFGDA